MSVFSMLFVDATLYSDWYLVPPLSTVRTGCAVRCATNFAAAPSLRSNRTAASTPWPAILRASATTATNLPRLGNTDDRANPHRRGSSMIWHRANPGLADRTAP
jgi:hypothetical protein